MPISLAHDIHKKRDPLSEYEKNLALADDYKRGVLACPFGCGQPGNADMDEYGLCDHVVGFTNCTRPDGTPMHSPDGEVKRPEGAVIELLDTDQAASKRPSIKKKNDEGVVVEVPDSSRDQLGRRKMTKGREPLRVGDYLIRVNGTSRRVYRNTVAPVPAPPATTDKKLSPKDAPAG